jgi:hypothetical protein
LIPAVKFSFLIPAVIAVIYLMNVFKVTDTMNLLL